MTSRLLFIFSAVALLLFTESVQAQKPDVVILKNGDRITGEIMKLEAGLLKFETDTMGTVNIEWRPRR